MKSIKSLKAVLLLMSIAACAVSAQTVNRPTPASSYSSARAVDNLVREVVPTNAQISQIAYDTVAANRASLIPASGGNLCGLARDTYDYSSRSFYTASLSTCNGYTISSSPYSRGLYANYYSINCPGGYSPRAVSSQLVTTGTDNTGIQSEDTLYTWTCVSG